MKFENAKDMKGVRNSYDIYISEIEERAGDNQFYYCKKHGDSTYYHGDDENSTTKIVGMYLHGKNYCQKCIYEFYGHNAKFHALVKETLEPMEIKDL